MHKGTAGIGAFAPVAAALLLALSVAMGHAAMASDDGGWRDPVRLERRSDAERQARLDRAAVAIGIGGDFELSEKHRDRDKDDDDDDDLGEQIAAAFIEILIRVAAEAFMLTEGTDGTHMSLHYGYARERQQRDLVLHDFDLRLFKRFSFAGDELAKGDNWAWGGFGLRFGGHGSSDESRGANEERLARLYMTVPVGFGYVHDWKNSRWLGSMGAVEIYGELGLTAGTSINLSGTPAPVGPRSHTSSGGLRVGTWASVGYSAVTLFGSITAEGYPGGTFHDRVWGVKLGPPLVNILSLSLGQRKVEYLGVEKTFEFVALTLSFRF